MKLTITGPNPHGGMFHVHRTGCADLNRGVYKQLAAHKARTGCAEMYEEDHASIRSVVEEVYSDMIDEFGTGDTRESYLEFKFFPCTDGLPYEDETEVAGAAPRRSAVDEWLAGTDADGAEIDDDAHLARYDDDPSPYAGTYSEE